MDQMHDEVLKLEGQLLSINGLKSSLVSSAEEDEWETVGPQNTSAVTRTQSFVPSELSDIFGGQLILILRKDELFFREGWVTIKEHYVRPPRWWKEFHLQDGCRLIVINLLQLPPALY
ncbi:ubiquitin carboxyl-terminal hydrolase 24 isoform X2 [Prunus yedoensis var. nudiflora]|uniref:Ubiquitin carboxyl-terminal hydrolase 24 isoform X2 n=1 Tax=Prunus yedoensis var. nudiflora TaxID=2094558 RepID=A0A314UYJ7_PRUYE|nr:ubiquitin carboxyl-terminal hydrolase 24 isoform X2 [Prunus yedoensis var. nudiflora]PQM41604.1 ubiquitin carboxyl-terminal hydrolase 24 isoform X2 [Prunus yedoensis var. nudiflora]PQQ05110.1 ubiquitin carboxyl-terminal hydrolase 24 isoform X2 [Prunus yedoensis var. nudiflora]